MIYRNAETPPARYRSLHDGSGLAIASLDVLLTVVVSIQAFSFDKDEYMGMHHNETIHYAHHIYLTLICSGISL
jgi:hypothetical protein